MKPNTGFKIKNGKAIAIKTFPIIWMIFESKPAKFSKPNNKMVTIIVAIRDVNETFKAFLKKTFIKYSFPTVHYLFILQ